MRTIRMVAGLWLIVLLVTGLDSVADKWYWRTLEVSKAYTECLRDRSLPKYRQVGACGRYWVLLLTYRKKFVADEKRYPGLRERLRELLNIPLKEAELSDA